MRDGWLFLIPNQLRMDAIMLLIGIFLGVVGGWLVAKFKYESRMGVQPAELQENFVSKELYGDVKRDLFESQQQIIHLNKNAAALEQANKELQEKLRLQKSEVEEIRQQFRTEFKNLANDLLDEKSRKFTEVNEEKLSALLNPLKERIADFRIKIEQNFHEDIRERASLKQEIEHLLRLNQQLSQDAVKLTNALKGDSKVQGDWGEIQLEIILERAGLEKDLHFFCQSSFLDSSEHGKAKRPDYIICLPKDKHLILDAKVSLTAYENYFNTEDEQERSYHLKEHLSSIYRHMNGLSSKNYEKLYQINPPDYVIMFVPVEPTLLLAMKEDIRVFEKCLEKNIVLVSTSTLLATLRTISYLWKQENQRKHVFEIAKESGALYDKFVGFVEDLGKIGDHICSAHESYKLAMNKLTDGKGNLVRRVEKIKKLGASASKDIPLSVLDKAANRDLA